MHLRGTKRLYNLDSDMEESDTIPSKYPNKEVESEHYSSEDPLGEAEYENAMNILKKQRDDSLLLIKTEHQMRLDSANKLAKYEEDRLQEYYDNEVKELKRKIIEEKSQSNKRSTSEGIGRKHRIVASRGEEVSPPKKEDITLTIPLAEDTVIEDVRFMVSESFKMKRKYNPNSPNVVVILPGGRLIVNDFYIEPGMSCIMKSNIELLVGQFLSADSKEVLFKPDKEKRKKIPLDLLRSGEVMLSSVPEVETLLNSHPIVEPAVNN